MHLYVRLAHAVVVGVATAAVLILNAREQLYDSNLIHLAEGVALLAGDHPYRDFFEWGIPAGAYLSMIGQQLTGYRLLGEFLVHWIFMTAGVVLSFQLALKLSGSVIASFATLVVALLLLSMTPTYHYSKLFVFPVALWSAWRYVEQPGVPRAAVLGAVGAIGFLFRHDYGVYIMELAIAAGVMVLISEAPRQWAGILARHAVAAIAAAMIVLTPWTAAVASNEGLAEYVEARTRAYDAPPGFAYRMLANVNPWRDLRPHTPPPQPGVIAFTWNRGRVDAALQRQLEQLHQMRLLPDPDERGRLLYEIPNVFDTRLLELDPFINDGIGIDWDRLEEIRLGFPPPDNALRWLAQVMLALSLVIAVAGAWTIWRHRHGEVAAAERRDGRRLLLAGIFLIAIDLSLFRQPSYMVVVAPLSLALGGRFLVRGPVPTRVLALVVLLLTAYASAVWTREAPMYEPSRLRERVSEAAERLLASPPVSENESFRYLYECTAPGDRLLVTGSSPYDVPYYTERSFAGGHFHWHHMWRSDPKREAESLQLLMRQRVPFAVSTTDPLLDEFKHYPRIRQYLLDTFKPVDGYDGKLFVNTRLEPIRRYGEGRLECFR